MLFTKETWYKSSNLARIGKGKKSIIVVTGKGVRKMKNNILKMYWSIQMAKKDSIKFRFIRYVGLFLLFFICLFMRVSTGDNGLLNVSFASNPSVSDNIITTELSLETELVSSPVKYTVMFPKNYEASGKTYPLFLFLHGGDYYPEHIKYLYPIIRELWENGSFPEMIVVTPNCDRSFYMDYKDGSEKWESFILNELLPDLYKKYRISKHSKDTFIGGISMGGAGSLRIGFKYPNKFAAIVSWEPAIEPALEWKKVKAEDKSYRGSWFYTQKFGEPIDETYWKKNNPSTIANEKADEIRNSAIKIYIEVGTEDQCGLFRGVEFLHRILFDKNIPHEFRYVYGGYHFSSNKERVINGLLFLNRIITSP